MEDAVLPDNQIYHNNGDVEWQPLALTLVEYPKGFLHFFQKLHFIIVTCRCSNFL